MTKENLTNLMRRPLALAGGLALVGGAAVATGAIPSSGSGEVHLCFQKRAAQSERGGAELRIFDDEQNPGGCLKGDRQIAINQEGPQGKQGPQGEQGPQGQQGPQGEDGATGRQGQHGPQGPQGPQGASGSSTAFFSGQTGVTLVNNTGTVATKNVPAGNFAITTSLTLFNNDDDDPAYVLCELLVGGTVVDDVLTDSLAENDADKEAQTAESVSMQTVTSGFGGGAITTRCTESGDSDQVVANGSLTAIKVDSVQ